MAGRTPGHRALRSAQCAAAVGRVRAEENSATPMHIREGLHYHLVDPGYMAVGDNMEGICE
jgi:hypothetical protein